MSNSNFYCLVMSGGKGTRFWPESTSKKPKQYLKLLGNESLLTQSLKRFDGIVPSDFRYVITVRDQQKLAEECSKNLAKDIILEPFARNTAPSILFSIARILKNGASAKDIITFVPSDHVILNIKGFQKTLKIAFEATLKEGKIVTIGIPPTFPHIGYGYIQKDSTCSENVYKVKEFKEKPTFDTAKEYIATGDYFWNAGMFVASVETFLKEFEQCCPETYSYFQAICDNLGNTGKIKEIYRELKADSIDYAVMERSENILVVPAFFDWNDLGSWDALENVVEKQDGNTVIDSKAFFQKNSKGNVVYTPKKVAALIGVNDLIVVANEKTVLVLPKKDSQKVKEIVSLLEENGHKDLI